MNIARQSTFYPVGSHAGEGSKATFGSAFGYFVPIRGPLQDRVELGILAGTGGDPNKAKAAPCRNIVGNGPSPMAPKRAPRSACAWREIFRRCVRCGERDIAWRDRKADIGPAGRQAATSHNLDEPLIRALRPVGVITGKLSLIAARRSAMSSASTNRFRLENPDAGTRSAFNVSH
jgi:hypothetical protein